MAVRRKKHQARASDYSQRTIDNSAEGSDGGHHHIRYNDVCKLIDSTAKSRARTTGLPYEDLRAQANLIFCEAVMTYNPEAGTKFSTWLYLLLNRGLTNWVKKEYNHINHHDTRDAGELYNVPTSEHTMTARRVCFRQRLTEMSPQARTVVHAALEDRLHLHGPGEGPPTARRKLKAKLKNHYGWPKAWIDAAFAEIRSTLEHAAGV